ncbi:MAG: secretin N-terminal domain-containing protein [Candidatus Omnitrophota bacterium]
MLVFTPLRTFSQEAADDPVAVTDIQLDEFIDAGQTETQEEVVTVDSTEEASVVEQEAKGEGFTDGKITLDLHGVDIQELLKWLSQKSGITITTTSQVAGRVTAFFNNLTLEEVLDVISTSQNLAYEKKGNVVRMMAKSEYEETYGQKFGERKEVRTIKLSYAKPSSVLNLIAPFQSTIGQIIVDDPSGTMLVSDTPENIALIEKTIDDLDQPLQTMFFDINYANTEDIKTHVSTLTTPELGKVITDERSHKLIVSDLPKRLLKIGEIVKELDEASRQVLITGEIIEISLKDKFSSGVEWEKIFGERAVDLLDVTGVYKGTLDESDVYQEISMGVLGMDKYKVVMKMLQEYGDTKVLSRPRLVVVNNEEAQIMVGRREAYVTESISQADTVVTSESVEFIDVGVKLNVLPSIGKDGFITMKIKPEISDVLDTVAGTSIPIVGTSETETVVKIKDGTTLMMGGLLKETHSEIIQGVPFLSKIPIIGLIFGSRARENPTRSEIVIFLTPQLITGDGRLVREVENEKG